MYVEQLMRDVSIIAAAAAAAAAVKSYNVLHEAVARKLCRECFFCPFLLFLSPSLTSLFCSLKLAPLIRLRDFEEHC